MTTSMLAFGKAKAAKACIRLGCRLTNGTSTANLRASSTTAGNGKRTEEDVAVQRDLFVNVLHANATKRDAKQYLARFKTPPVQKQSKQDERHARLQKDQDRLDRSGVNLGGLYAPARAIADSPQFVRSHADSEKSQANPALQLHVALVCVRNLEAIDDADLDGLAVTLSQLVKLDMRIILVLDTDDNHIAMAGKSPTATNVRSMRTMFAQQALRISDALERHNTFGGRFIPGTLEQVESSASGSHPGLLKIALPKLLFEPLKRSVVPIIPSLAYSATGQLLRVSSVDVMTALTRRFVGLQTVVESDNAYHETDEAMSIDRIIVLDPLGGIPSKARGDDAHVFINLEQEYNHIKNELQQYSNTDSNHASSSGNDSPQPSQIYGQHSSNLDMVQKCLALLPSSSSALIITPQEAASSAHASRKNDVTIGAGTRSQRNTLIHNLLTNKPVVSSSLPTARLPTTDANSARPAIPAATLIKRGMPVTMIPPPPTALGWETPTGPTPLDLQTDPSVDFARLVHLINDSFRRELDAPNYLARIPGRTAGLIVAGSYEGAAILTWEQPPNTTSPARLVPYLDKFAVLQSSQGSAGVADVVFHAMVRTCFPQGVCWRSRSSNPVNKWYFERAAGHWRIPDTQWTMFWTGEGVVEDRERWEDYVGVCKSVVPTWKDGRRPD